MGLLSEIYRSYSGGLDETLQMDKATHSMYSGRSSTDYTEDYLPLDSAISEVSFYNDSSIPDEGRLSRALQSWMTDHVITPIEPLTKPPIQPVYSGRLGKRPVLYRVPSEESIATNISLLSCSDLGDEPAPPQSLSRVSTGSKRRRRKKETESRPDTAAENQKPSGYELKQVKPSILNKYSRMHRVADLAQYSVYFDEEDELLKRFSKEDQRLIRESAKRTGIHTPANIEKCPSQDHLNYVSRKKTNISGRDVHSAGSSPRESPVNFEEIRQQIMKEQLESMQLKKKDLRKGRRSRMSSVSSINTDMIPRTPSIRSLSPESEPEMLTVWKGDGQILEMDLRRGFTEKVKTKISSTTTAINRVTGEGETNAKQRMVGRHEEFPNYVEEDYGYIPKIMQRIRISPNLSKVIKDDIKVRMGRPRYHEIRTRDLEMWNKGQKLDKAHRNLKVFTWLHSLKEDSFVKNVESVISKRAYTSKNTLILHVESADEPDQTPLYQKKFEVMRPKHQ